METLGFFEPPEATWSSPAAQGVEQHPRSDTTQTTELFEIPTGRHTKHVEPTGDLVRDIWESTELHAPSLIDWEPQTVNTARLGDRNFRWPVVFGVLFAVLGVAALGYWILGRPDSAAAAARESVEAQATLLVGAFDQAGPLIEALDDERLPAASRDSTVFFDIGETARAMFAASSALPTSDATGRTAAADAAGIAIDASRRLMDATAYRTALEPALTLPLLETNPDLTDLAVATAAFTEWRTGFEAMQEALPENVGSRALAALTALTSGLDATQTAYLDAMREADQSAAVVAIGELKAAISSIRVDLITDMAEISGEVAILIEDARSRIQPLLG